MATEYVHPLHDIPALSPCPSWFRQELIDDAKNIAIVAVLGIINAAVIVGNLLVVLAVFASAKLRTVTNFIIVSLAVSDLLVGLAVLPYSITLEVLELWIFGELWCQMWLAMDVWLCTASILNLCAISVDRYLAITRPVHYRTIMSNLRVKLLIAVVWVLSFIICFPPLVGWNDRVKDDEDITPLGGGNITRFLGDLDLWTDYIRIRQDTANGNLTEDVTSYATNVSLTEELRLLLFRQSGVTSSAANGSGLEELRLLFRNGTTSRRCPKPQCALITNQGYVIYSALGSFYIPMLVMLFFYYRIYVVALRTSRALDRGFRTAKSKRVKASSAAATEQGGNDNPDVTLRIHRGRPSNESACSSRGGPPSNQPTRRPGDILVPRRIPTVVYHHTREYSSPRCFREDKQHFYTTTESCPQQPSRFRRTRSANASLDPQADPGGVATETQRNGKSGRGMFARISRRKASNSSFDRSPSTSADPPPQQADRLTVGGSATETQRNGGKRHLFTRISKRNARWHAKRFRTEAKATKTVGIIVGGFILCWLPFFTVYLTMGFCGGCIPEPLFKVFFYLGYCNSALNPLIYGMVSKDFRFAFKKILCRCKLKDDGVTSLIRQIHMPTFFEEEASMMTTMGESVSQS